MPKSSHQQFLPGVGGSTNNLLEQFIGGRCISPKNIRLNAQDGTFRSNSGIPLHSWFPYLEGFSADFVRKVKQSLLPDSERILEPFAGSGTTPIVLGQDRGCCEFSEANPVMKFIAETKISSLSEDVDRKAISSRLVRIAEKMESAVMAAAGSKELEYSYESLFSGSKYFSPEALKIFLQLRNVNDQVFLEHGKLIGECFSLAIISALIPSSLLKRAGDLRFRTPKELKRGLANPIEFVKSRLQKMAADIECSQPISGEVAFLCQDASQLSEANQGRLRFDGLITSPPYLNGTNYIRNARLELWYLGFASEAADLRSLRDIQITSGINDVCKKTKIEPMTKRIFDLRALLEENAYDSRISRMVCGYFSDMHSFLSSARDVLLPGSPVCIDIGDSSYAGIHVPTDVVLAEIATDLDFKFHGAVPLRKRRSKGGMPLRQVLLVFET